MPCTESDRGISSLWIEYLDNQGCDSHLTAATS